MNGNEKIQEELVLKVTLETVINHLKSKINSDALFKKEIRSIVDYYGAKFVTVQPSEEKRHIATELIDDLIFSQIAHGYFFLTNELAEDKIEDGQDKTFQKEFWEMRPGILRNVVGVVAFKLFGDNWFKGIGLNSVNKLVLQELPDSFDLYLTILEETAIYGGYLAIKEDEKFKRIEEDQEMNGILLGNPLDIHFLNPQVYMQYGFFSNQHESWELFLGQTSSRQEKWIGSIHLSKIPELTTENKHSYYLNIMIEDLVLEHEKVYICKEIIKMLPKVIQESVQFRVYHLARTPEIYEAKKLLNF